MAFTRVRTINGKQYRYLEERWREGKKVRSRSTSLGPVSGGGLSIGSDGDADMGWLRRQLGRSYGIDWDAIARQEIERQNVESAQYAARHATLYLDYGLKLGPATPVEVEKPVPVVDLSAPATMPDAAQENAPPDGEAEASGTPDQ